MSTYYLYSFESVIAQGEKKKKKTHILFPVFLNSKGTFIIYIFKNFSLTLKARSKW